MPNDPQFAPKRIAFLIFPDFQLLDLSGPLQVFATANQSRDAPLYELYTLALVAGVVQSSSGLSVIAEPLPSADTPVDTVIVVGGPGTREAMRDAGLLDWLWQQSRNARRVASVCTGAFVLAAAGLLDGRRVTTHWSQCGTLAAAFPCLSVESDPIYVADGAVWTSAGITAGIDMALAMIEADHGRPLATDVARHLVVFARRPGGQAQFSAGLTLAGDDDRFDALHDWMRQNLRTGLSVPALAKRAGMSERSFLRRYRQATGITPARAVERIRVEAARQALGATALPLKRIAHDCGFGSEETMRRSFLRILAVPPNAYRERFPV